MKGLEPLDTLELEYEEYHNDLNCPICHRTVTVAEFEKQLRLRFIHLYDRDRYDGERFLRLDLASDVRPGNTHMFRSIESRRGYEFLAIDGLPRHISPELKDAIDAAKRWQKDPSASLAGEGPRLAGVDADQPRRGPRR